MPSLSELLREAQKAYRGAEGAMDAGLPMQGRATFLPYRDTLPGSVMNQREVAMPGLLASLVNAFTAPGRALRGTDPNFQPEQEAMNLAGTLNLGSLATGAVRRPGELGIFAGIGDKDAKNVAGNTSGNMPNRSIPSPLADSGQSSSGYLPAIPKQVGQSSLSRMARSSSVGEKARSIFDAQLHRDPSIVAEDFGLSTVTKKQVDIAANDLFTRTQESLKSRGIVGDVTVYRAGNLTDHHDSFSWKPWGTQRENAIPYKVNVKDILFDTDAIIPSGHYAESEVFIRHGSAKPITSKE